MSRIACSDAGHDTVLQPTHAEERPQIPLSSATRAKAACAALRIREKPDLRHFPHPLVESLHVATRGARANTYGLLYLGLEAFQDLAASLKNETPSEQRYSHTIV